MIDRRALRHLAHDDRVDRSTIWELLDILEESEHLLNRNLTFLPRNSGAEYATKTFLRKHDPTWDTREDAVDRGRMEPIIDRLWVDRTA